MYLSIVKIASLAKAIGALKRRRGKQWQFAETGRRCYSRVLSVKNHRSNTRPCAIHRRSAAGARTAAARKSGWNATGCAPLSLDAFGRLSTDAHFGAIISSLMVCRVAFGCGQISGSSLVKPSPSEIFFETRVRNAQQIDLRLCWPPFPSPYRSRRFLPPVAVRSCWVSAPPHEQNCNSAKL